ncbi:MAG: uncharacterized protein QOI80_2750, partial [Solirubrobacteraceae bacterium]|nr:uncharacterized protein [Solirubrobacteraceae bacterium]
SAVGFGFALVCAPLLFAALGPAEAVWSLNALALLVNTVTLLLEGRRPEPLRRLAVTVLAWSVPGMVAGAVVLQSVDPVWLQVALTVTVFATLVLRGRPGSPQPAPAWAPPTAGVASGVLTTALSTAGPPLVLLLLGRGHAPTQVRDTLTTIFVAQSVLGIAALAVTGTDGVPGPGLLLFAAVALAGQVAGRPLFGRLSGGGYEGVLTAVLVASAAIGLVAALT